jgi:Tol biopolymer transport system component
MYHVKVNPFGTFLATTLTLITISDGNGPAAWSLHNEAEAQCLSQEKIVFTKADPANPFETAEIYIMNPDGSEPLRLTYDHVADTLPSLSPDGKGKIVFDSNRTVVAFGEPVTSTNSHLFLMNADGTSDTGIFPTPLTLLGSSATWSPDGKWIAFHRSRSGGIGTRIPGRTEPGGPTRDSDIFVVNLDDLLAHGDAPTNITETFEGQSDDDADWSPNGDKIVFTSRNSACGPRPPLTATEAAAECQAAAEIWLMNADGTNRERLTFNSLEERSPDWSPDGTKILYLCRLSPGTPFEICVMNPDGTGHEVLTNNAVPDLTSSWSPDGTRIAFTRGVGGQQQNYVMNYAADENGSRNEIQLTDLPTINLFPNWGTVAVGVGCRVP